MLSNPFTLKSKRILITGASSGIGKQVAISISKMGAKVIISARNEIRLKETFQQLSGNGHQYILADLTRPDDLQTLISSLPVLNGLVHCAGIVKLYPVKFINASHLEKMQTINYTAPVLLTGGLLKRKKLAKKSSIVFISSISSKFPYKGGAAYTGYKAALEAYSKVIAVEHAHQGIRSNCICPAMVQTPLFSQMESVVSKESMEQHKQSYPLGVGEPLDVAYAAIFLLSDATKWITGTNMRLDGGLSISL